MIRTAWTITLAVLVSVLPVRAQQSAPPAPGAAAPAPAPGTTAPQVPLPTPPADYVYTVDGRRDPFVPAIGRGPAVAPAQATTRPAGVAGVMTAEFVVRGILESQGAWVAMVRASDGRTYAVHPGDRLMDGTVRTITADAVVILQEVNDSLSMSKQREVRKLLRGGDEVQ